METPGPSQREEHEIGEKAETQLSYSVFYRACLSSPYPLENHCPLAMGTALLKRWGETPANPVEEFIIRSQLRAWRFHD